MVKPNLTLRGQELPATENPVFLGIKLNPHLTIAAHINDLKTKMSGRRHCLRARGGDMGKPPPHHRHLYRLHKGALRRYSVPTRHIQ